MRRRGGRGEIGGENRQEGVTPICLFSSRFVETIVILQWTLLVAMPSWVSVDRAFEFKVSIHFWYEMWGKSTEMWGNSAEMWGNSASLAGESKGRAPLPLPSPPPRALPLLHLHGFYESVCKATHPHLPRPDFLFLSAVVDSITVWWVSSFKLWRGNALRLRSRKAFKERVCFMMFLNLRLQQSVYVMCILAVKRSIAWGGELGGGFEPSMLQSCSIIGLDATDPSSRVRIGKVIRSKLVGCHLNFRRVGLV